MTVSSGTTRRVLNLPAVDRLELGPGFVRTATCELRFPTLLRFAPKVPEAFQKALRSEYPNVEQAKVVTGLAVSIDGAERQTEDQYQFKSRNSRWLATLRPSAVGLETSHYPGFPEFAERLEHVVTQARPLIDANFFTRVGLRYINALPFTSAEGFRGWLNAALVGPMTDGPYGDLTTFWQEARGAAPGGEFSFRHGLAPAKNGGQEYIVDIDFYDEDVEFADTMTRVRELHEQNHRFFRWVLGPEGLEALRRKISK
jgi:uncharacterized protein (TIGR04255 family)